MDFLKIPGNEETFKQLEGQKGLIVPFIGAGFSCPACPGWAKILEIFFQDLKKEERLNSEDVEQYITLSKNKQFEQMADFLVEKAGRLAFEDVIKTHFDTPLKPGMEKKFELLHRAFKCLKITTNFDCLIENNALKGSHVHTCFGTEPEELGKLFTKNDRNCLLKIHGDLGDPGSIILSSSQYEAIYGHSKTFNPHSALPEFLKRVFTNASVLFIGCSLEVDRTIEVLKNLEVTRPLFAIMMWPDDEKERVSVNRRLSNLRIKTLWITDYAQIETILERIAGTELTEIKPDKIVHEGPVTFVGRQSQLKQIEESIKSGSGSVEMITGRLFNIEGTGGVGKTTLAIEAARRFSKSFKDGVLAPFRVDKHTPMSFAVELAGRFQLKVNELSNPESARQIVTNILKERHALLILDNAVEWKDLIYMIPEQTASTILITTRSRQMYKRLRLEFRGLNVHEINVEKFTKAEALALFKEMLENEYREEETGIYLEIAVNLGFLPIALRQVISLILFGPQYRAPMLLEKLKKEDRLQLLRDGIAAEDSGCRAIETVFDLSSLLMTKESIEALEYLAICASGPAPIEFLKQLSKDEEIEKQLNRLYSFSWIERWEREGKRVYELHQLVRELVKRLFGNRFREELIRSVHEIFTDPGINFRIKEELYSQLEEAFALAKENKDKRLINWLKPLFNFCIYRGYANFYIRLTEVVEELFPEDKGALRAVYGNRALIFYNWEQLDKAMGFHKKMEKICEELGDRAGLAACYGNQALIFYDWGQLKEAMVLQKKDEKIKEELGDRAGLARSYSNQALILSDLGQLEEAIVLHKKEEKISEELGNQAQLSRSYGNQAIILYTQGKLKKAMNLHKKEEKISEKLGDRAQLSRSYGNQAVILFAHGKLEEAMVLHKKEEKISEELGDRAGLSNCYCNQAVILFKSGQLDEAICFFKRQEKICEELRDQSGLATCYGNQAGIFYVRNKLDEAMNLHKKEEKICNELGNRVGLAISWWNQGLIYKEKGDYTTQAELWRKSIEANKSMGISTQIYEEALKELEESIR